MIQAWLLSLLLTPAWGYTPIAIRSSTDTRTINNNLLDIANEMERRSLNTGGTINGDLTVSSGIVSNGSNTWTGTQATSSTATFTGPVIGVSTVVIVALNTFSQTQTSYGTCAAGSTMTATANIYEVCFDGSTVTDGGGGNEGWSFLVDGVFPTGLTSSIGVADGGASDARQINISGCYKELRLAYASHAFCFTSKSTSGAADCSNARCHFSVRGRRE